MADVARDYLIQEYREQIAAVSEEYRSYGDLIDERRERGEPVDDLLEPALELRRMFIRLTRELRRLISQRTSFRRPELPAPTVIDLDSPSASNSRGSMLAAWRAYAGFRADLQERERILRLTFKGEITYEMLARQLRRGDSVKSIKRQMHRYHLDPDRDWPPSTWPEEEPQPLDNDTIHRLSLVAGTVAVIGLADNIACQMEHVASVAHHLKILG